MRELHPKGDRSLQRSTEPLFTVRYASVVPSLSIKRADFMDGNGNQPGFSFEPIGRSGESGIYAVASLLCTSLFPAGRALANKEGLSLQHPALTGICSRWSHIPLRLRRGFANKKVKGPSEQAQGPFTFLFAVRAGFEPAVRLPVRQFSKLVVSATHPSHQADPFIPMGLQRYK